MIRTLLFLLFFLFTGTINAQQFNWVRADTAEYAQNPDFMSGSISGRYTGHVASSLLIRKELIYGQFIYGEHHVRMHDDAGNLEIDFVLGNKAWVDWVEATATGNIIVCGSFMDTLWLDGTDSMLVNSPALFAQNAFMICISPSGQLLWKKNLTLLHPVLTTVEAMTLDNNGNCWYGFSNFQEAFIAGVDTNGQDITTYHIIGDVRTLSGLSFDPAGNLYVSGAAQNGSITFGGFTKVFTEPYNMYLFRMNTAGQVNWMLAMHDITFQHPRVKADPFGNVFFSGHLMDSVSIGNFSLPAPQWAAGIVLAKIDSNGNALWVNGVPVQPTVTGTFIPGKGMHLDADSLGGCVVLGRTQGEINWGNGIITGTPGLSSNYHNSIIAFNANGLPVWKLDASAPYVSPVGLCLRGNASGYILAVDRGNSQYGNISITQPDPFAVYTVVAQFEGTTTGLATQSVADDFTVFPNPSIDGNIRFSRMLKEGIIRIYGLNGQVIRSFEFNLPLSEIQLNLPQGSYILEYRSKEEVSHIPLIICQ